MKSNNTLATGLLAVAAACLPFVSSGQIPGMALDQGNDNFGYYFNNLSTAWQSFTAGTQGHLGAIQAHIYSTGGADWSATLEIRMGSGTSGSLLASQAVVGDGVNQPRAFVLEKPIRQTPDDVFSFVFRNASTGLTVRASADLYAAGRSHHASYDYNFKTWLLASDWSAETWRDTGFTAESTVIATPAQLAQFAWLVNGGTTFAGKTLALGADIDLGAHYWTPAGGESARFNGVFKGAGHVISGLYIENPGVPCQGLFGVTGINASVEDLTIAQSDIRGGDYTGGIVGRAYGEVRRCRAAGVVAGGSMVGGVAGCAEGILEGCANAAAVSGGSGIGGVAGLARGGAEACANSGAVSGAWAGGIAAISGGTIRNCVNRGAVVFATPDGVVGGIVGENNFGSIVNCANEGAVGGSGASCFAGGLVGWNWGGAIRNGVGSGAVTGTEGGDLGGIAGRNDGGGSVAGCFWKRTGAEPFALDAVGVNAYGAVAGCQPFGAAPGTLGSPVTVDGLQTDSLAGALNAWMAMTRDGEGAPLRRWTPGSASAYPTLVESRWSDEGNFATNWYGAAEADLTIGTPAELAGLAALVNAGVDFQGRRVSLSSDIELEGREWTPIGAVDEDGAISAPFAGTFDGNGKTVSGLYVDRQSSLGSAGLFGAARQAILVNLTVASADIAASGFAGGVCGVQAASWIANCSSGGRISGDEAAGGIAGRVDGIVVNCWSDARVRGSAVGWVAGLAPGVPQVGRCYWRRTGAAPFDLPAVAEGGADACSAFAEPPGLLAEPPAELPPTLAGALNDLARGTGELYGIALYGWTSGSTNRYPVMTPLIRVGGEAVEEALSDGFCSGMTYPQVDAAVAVYTSAHPATTAENFGALMGQADAMGFTFGELAADDAILDFSPSLVITSFDPASGSLTFAVANGIDATPEQAMARLSASTTGSFVIEQFDSPGGKAVEREPVVVFLPEGKARASFPPDAAAVRAFYRVRLGGAQSE